jgi:hypothetical protein
MIETRWQLLNKIWALSYVLRDLSRHEAYHASDLRTTLHGLWYRHYERGPLKQVSTYQRLVQKILIKKNPALLGTVKHGEKMYTYKRALKPDRKNFLHYNCGMNMIRFSIEEINSEADEQLELFGE